MRTGGGTFVSHNKILPGAYLNFVSQPRAMSSLGVRGIVAGLLNLDWGVAGEIVTVDNQDFQTNSLTLFGYSFTDPELVYVRELFLGAKTLKYFRPAGGTKAVASIGDLSVQALYPGIRGNDLKIIIEPYMDDENDYLVTTLLGVDNIEVDSQRVSDLEALQPNDFVTFIGEGEPETTAGINLKGGTNQAVTGNDYTTFLGFIEKENFTTLFYPGSDPVTKGLFTSFTKRLRDEEGFKITTVLHKYSDADFEGIISVKNEVAGTHKEALVYWVAGMSSGAQVNETLTNRRYHGTLSINSKYSPRELEEAIVNGEFVFYGETDHMKVVRDINTFTSFHPHKNQDFSNNQVIRVLDEIGNRTAQIFSDFFLGQIQNDELGRDLFKVELINYNEKLQALGAITNFTAEDITIIKGQDKGDVVVDQYIEPVGSMEKLYMTVKVL